MGLILVEIAARVVTPITIKNWVQTLTGERRRECAVKDKLLHHGFLPNCKGMVKTWDFEVEIVTNSLGLREREIELRKIDGIYRVLILGDSFAQGWGVEQKDRFSEQASRRLKERDGARVEIINAGVNSYTPILELEYWRTKGIKLEPDLVVLILDFSDLHDDYYYGGWRRHERLRQELLPGSLEPIKERVDREERWFDWLVDNSRLVSYVYTRAKGIWLGKNQQLGWENLFTDWLIYERAMEWEGYDEAWNLPVANLVLMKEYLESQEIEMAVAVAPKGMFYENEWQAGREFAGFKLGEAYSWRPVRMIENKLEKQGVEVLKWYESFLEAKAKPLFYDYDGHWTPAAHLIVAEQLTEYLEAIRKEF